MCRGRNLKFLIFTEERKTHRDIESVSTNGKTGDGVQLSNVLLSFFLFFYLLFFPSRLPVPVRPACLHGRVDTTCSPSFLRFQDCRLRCFRDTWYESIQLLIWQNQNIAQTNKSNTDKGNVSVPRAGKLTALFSWCRFTVVNDSGGILPAASRYYIHKNPLLD